MLVHLPYAAHFSAKHVHLSENHETEDEVFVFFALVSKVFQIYKCGRRWQVGGNNGYADDAGTLH